MTILVLAPWWITETSGVGQVIKHLGHYLAARGHHVILLDAIDSSSKGELDTWGFETYKLDLRAPVIVGHRVRSALAFTVFLPMVLSRLMRLLKTKSVDVLNVHYPVDASIYAALCRTLLPGRLRLVTSVHGADLFPEGRAQPRYSRALRTLLARSDAIVGPSRSFMNDMRARFPALAPKLVAIHSGIRPDEFAEAPASVGGEPYILCVAMHNEKKGLDTLIQAFRRVATERERLTLRLVGNGPLRPALEQLVRDLGLSGRVEFLGDRSRAEIAPLMKRADMLVLPSRSEPFGIVLLEAASSRTPIVATNVGGIPEIIQDDVSGLLVPADHPGALSAAMLRLLASPDLRAALVASAYETVSTRFLSEVMGARYQDLMLHLTRTVRRHAAAPIAR